MDDHKDRVMMRAYLGPLDGTQHSVHPGDSYAFLPLPRSAGGASHACYRVQVLTSEPGVLSLIYDPMDEGSDPSAWLATLDELAARHAEASEAHDVFAIDALHADPADDAAEEVAEQISDDCRAIHEEMIAQVAWVPDGEIARAFLETDGSGPRADALCVVMKRRDIDF